MTAEQKSSQGNWPSFDELIAPLPQSDPKEVLNSEAAAFTKIAQEKGLRATVVAQPSRTGVRKRQLFFYLESSSPQQREELFHAEYGSDNELATQRYPVTLYYPAKSSYHGAALYDRGIVLLDEGTYAADTLEDALLRIFSSNYTRAIVGRMYGRVQEHHKKAAAELTETNA